MMISDSDKETLKKIPPESEHFRRAKALLLLSEGKKIPEIRLEIGGLSDQNRQTINRWREYHIRHGLAFLDGRIGKVGKNVMLRNEDRQALIIIAERSAECDSRRRIIAEALIMMDDGFRYVEIADRYNIAWQTAWNWAKAYKKYGLFMLFERRKHVYEKRSK